MQETMNTMSKVLGEKWTALSKKRKLIVSIGSGVVLLIVIGIGIFLSTPNMQVIYSRLELKQASQIAEVLKEEGIAYNITDNGTTVEVEKKQAVNAKIVLARENIPKGNYTFEDAINNSMSTTETEKNAKLHKLKETELENSLVLIDGIQAANVTLVIPQEKNSFIESKQESSASVLCDLNKKLTQTQIDGIARFIASSVQNLKIENINILDSEGNHLYKGGEEEQITYSKQQEAKTIAEQEIKTKLTELLGLTYDEIRVSPNLIINFDQYEESREQYTPLHDYSSSGIIKSEKVEETSQYNQAADADRESPTYQAEEGGNNGSSTTNKVVEYENNKVISNLTKLPGTVDLENSSLAVHVFINKEYRKSTIEPTLTNMTWEEYKEEKKKNQIVIQVSDSTKQAIKNATGIKDSIVVGYENPIFIEDIMTGNVQQITWNQILFVIVAAIGIWIIAKIIGSFRKDKEEEVQPIHDLDMSEVELSADEGTLEDIKLKEELESQKLINKFAEEKPEIVANILRNWLSEGEMNSEYDNN